LPSIIRIRNSGAAGSPSAQTHLGAGGVVHGGVIPLAFVEMLGLFVNSRGSAGSAAWPI